MKPIMDWIKKNWIVLVCAVLILGSLPTAWFFSTSWNKKIQGDQQGKGSTEYTKVTGMTVTYAVPSPIPGEKGLELKDAPNHALTEHFKAVKADLSRQTEAVLKRMSDFNRGVGSDAASVGRAEHGLLASELFPGPGEAEINKAAFGDKTPDQIKQIPEEARRKALAQAQRELIEPGLRVMEDALLGKKGKPDPYTELLRSTRAGEPPSPASVLRAINERRQIELAKMTAGSRELTPAEQAQLDDLSKKLRLGAYQSAARGFSVYLSRSALGPTGEGAASSAFRPLPTEAWLKAHRGDTEMFICQWDAWMLSDILAAVRLSNSRDGQPTDVEHSVVKRVERIGLNAPARLSGQEAQPDPAASGQPQAASPAAAAPGTQVQPNLAVSITGRASSPQNPDYEVRTAEIVAVVSSEELPKFLDALTRVNFNTVIGVRLDAVNVRDDLARGYAYGPGHVVRATVTLETVWLRSWLAPLMPASVKKSLGIS